MLRRLSCWRSPATAATAAGARAASGWRTAPARRRARRACGPATAPGQRAMAACSWRCGGPTADQRWWPAAPGRTPCQTPGPRLHRQAKGYVQRRSAARVALLAAAADGRPKSRVHTNTMCLVACVCRFPSAPFLYRPLCCFLPPAAYLRSRTLPLPLSLPPPPVSPTRGLLQSLHREAPVGVRGSHVRLAAPRHSIQLRLGIFVPACIQSSIHEGMGQAERCMGPVAHSSGCAQAQEPPITGDSLSPPAGAPPPPGAGHPRAKAAAARAASAVLLARPSPAQPGPCVEGALWGATHALLAAACCCSRAGGCLAGSPYSSSSSLVALALVRKTSCKGAAMTGGSRMLRWRGVCGCRCLSVCAVPVLWVPLCVASCHTCR
jgi:hypothetical protein